MRCEPSQALELAFRRHAARLVAQLARRAGGGRLDLAEDAVQFALLQAARLWPARGVPDEVDAWLARVAHNRLTDLLRGDRSEPGDEAREPDPVTPPAARLASELDDDELGLIFATCHPALSPELQLTLCLKVACGLGVREIARALLVDPVAVAQRIVRAKRTLATQPDAVEVPAHDALSARLGLVHRALYAMFNEGYERTEGQALVDVTLCAEALRLAEGVLGHARTATPEGHALAALFCFRGAALPTRVDAEGGFVPAARRGSADEGLIRRGLVHLGQSMGPALTAFHLEAELAMLQVSGPPGSWPWPRILELYDALVAVSPGPVVALNRAVAVAEVHGPRAGLEALERVADLPSLHAYPWRHAVEAELLRRAGELHRARAAFRRAAACATSAPQRAYLEGRVRACCDA